MAFSPVLTQNFSLMVQRIFNKTQRTPRDHPSPGDSSITLNRPGLLSEHNEMPEVGAADGQPRSPGQWWPCHTPRHNAVPVTPATACSTSALPGKLVVASWPCFLHKQAAHLRKNKELLVKGVKKNPRQRK